MPFPRALVNSPRFPSGGDAPSFLQTTHETPPNCHVKVHTYGYTHKHTEPVTFPPVQTDGRMLSRQRAITSCPRLQLDESPRGIAPRGSGGERRREISSPSPKLPLSHGMVVLDEVTDLDLWVTLFEAVLLVVLGLILAVGRRGYAKVHVELLEEEVVEGAAVAGVDPGAGGGALLLVLGVADDDPVVALGAGDGGGEPDLLVGGLFVDYVGSCAGEGDVENAGLDVGGESASCLWVNIMRGSPGLSEDSIWG